MPNASAATAAPDVLDKLIAGDDVSETERQSFAAALARGHVTDPSAPWVADLNRKFAWVEQAAMIYRLDYGDYITPDKFRTQLNNRKVPGSNGKLTGMGQAWLEHPNRRQHRKVVMRPGEPDVTDDDCINEWGGFVVQPAAGDVRWALRLLMRLVPEKGARKFVILWVAHLLQRPGERNHVALVFWSHEQGVGKNLLAECIVAIIGRKHATVIGQEQLTSTFNSWASNKVLVIGDEVSGSDRREEADKLKGLITGTSLHFNQKYQPVVEQPNNLNFIFLSNHNDAVFMEDADRRYHVNEITSPRLTPAEAASFAEKRDSGGLAALHYWLQRVDVSKFDPRAPAPMTAAKQQMIEDGRSDLEGWAVELLASDIVALLGREVVTAHELAQRYAHETARHSAPSTKTIVGVFKRLGAYVRPTQIRLAGGRKLRAMAIVRPDYWNGEPEAAWAAELGKPLRW